MQRLTGAVLIVGVSAQQRDLGCKSDAEAAQSCRTDAVNFALEHRTAQSLARIQKLDHNWRCAGAMEINH